MERNSNYYTPKIEEFYSGFEYEYLLTGSKNGKDAYEWIKSNEFSNDYPYNANPHYEVQRRCDTEEVRVKYLDREDIESFKFEYDPNYADLPELGFAKESTYLQPYTQYLLFYNPENKQLRIERAINCGTGEEDYLFNGIIKNKSELKKILIQTKVNETTTK